MGTQKTRLASLLCAVGIIVVQLHAGGTIQNVSVYSASLNMNRWVQIYLPAGYNGSDTTVRYEVIYFLHGATYNHTAYSGLFPILDTLIASHAIRPVIVAKPDGSAGPWGGSVYTNSALYGKFEDFIVYDLVTFIDSAYRTASERNKRCIMGHSMGAFGAMKAALKHPDVYCGVASHSGSLDVHHWLDRVPTIFGENGGHAPYTFRPTAGVSSYLAFTYAGAFSPNLLNTTYKVDFLLDVNGNVVDTIFAKWLAHSPARLAASVPPGVSPALYFDCGMQDELGAFPFNTGFKDSLELQGLAYTWLAYQGSHSDKLASRFPLSLRFLDAAMNASSTPVKGDSPMRPQSIVLYQNYPNPFNAETWIGYRVEGLRYRAGEMGNWGVKLAVYDLLGREVAVLVNEKKKTGTHEVKFNASHLASGVYLYRLTAGPSVDTRKMFLIR